MYSFLVSICKKFHILLLIIILNLLGDNIEFLAAWEYDQAPILKG